MRDLGVALLAVVIVLAAQAIGEGLARAGRGVVRIWRRK